MFGVSADNMHGEIRLDHDRICPIERADNLALSGRLQFI